MSETDAMINAILNAQIAGHRDRKPIVEHRLHPDDVMELKRFAWPVSDLSASPLLSFNGIRIIEDINAPRLPRLPPP